MGKHFSNQQCFKKKLKSSIFNQLSMKKINSTKTILKNKINKKTYGETL
jgi:hypothetical protein